MFKTNETCEIQGILHEIVRNPHKKYLQFILSDMLYDQGRDLESEQITSFYKNFDYLTIDKIDLCISEISLNKSIYGIKHEEFFENSFKILFNNYPILNINYKAYHIVDDFNYTTGLPNNIRKLLKYDKYYTSLERIKQIEELLLSYGRSLII